MLEEQLRSVGIAPTSVARKLLGATNGFFSRSKMGTVQVKFCQVLLVLDVIDRYYLGQIQRYQYTNPRMANYYKCQRDDWRRRFLAAFYPE